MADEHQAFVASAIDESEPVAARTWEELVLEAALLLPNLFKLLVGLLSDPRIPTRKKVLVATAVLYVASPVDLIPDFVVGVGYLDDIVLLAVVLDNLMSGVDEAIVIEHWDGTIDSLDLVRSAFAWGAEIVPNTIRKILPR
ncbi:MAG: YkvA family protein [Acidimicrobiia bacterium]